MTSDEILQKAKYIQFPHNNDYYTIFNVNNIEKLPIIKNQNNILYSNLKQNEHHYTTHYHYKYVIPCISKLFNLNFSEEDFNLIENIYKNNDLSYLKPKKEYTYTIKFLIRNIKYENVSFDFLINNKKISYANTPYHILYPGNHESSVIINNTIKNNKILFISGDSQMIPSILPLTNYYKQIWYMDNRSGWFKKDEKLQISYENTTSISQFYENVNFDDVLIELYSGQLERYTKINLK